MSNSNPSSGSSSNPNSFSIPPQIIATLRERELLGPQFVGSKVAHKVGDPVIVGWCDPQDQEDVPSLWQLENEGFFLSQRPLTVSFPTHNGDQEVHVYGGLAEEVSQLPSANWFVALGVYSVTKAIGNGRYQISPAWNLSVLELSKLLEKMGFPRLAPGYVCAHQALMAQL